VKSKQSSDVLSQILTFVHFGSRIRIWIRTFFIPVPGSYIKRGVKSKNYLFMLLMVSGRSLFLSQKDNSSRIRKKIIPDPDPGEKNHRIPDPLD
jgi:hypothetical protein